MHGPVNLKFEHNSILHDSHDGTLHLQVPGFRLFII